MTHELGPLPEPEWLGELRDGEQVYGYTEDQMRAYALAEVEKAVKAERERFTALLQSHKDRTTMSHFVSMAECHAARNALELVLDEFR